MAGIYRISEKELQFLLMFTEHHGLYGLKEFPLINTKEEAEECVMSLCEKGYLSLNQKKECSIDSTLELLLAVAEKPYGYLLMEDLRRENVSAKTAVYFLDDVIGIIDQRDEEYELLWLPHLPLAIGEVANIHSPFLNEKTELLHELISDDDKSRMDNYLKAGFVWQWELWGNQLEDEEKKCSFFILSNGKEQVMIKEMNGKTVVNKPDKAAYVNAITEWMIYVHGKAIRKMNREE